MGLRLQLDGELQAVEKAVGIFPLRAEEGELPEEGLVPARRRREDLAAHRAGVFDQHPHPGALQPRQYRFAQPRVGAEGRLRDQQVADAEARILGQLGGVAGGGQAFAPERSRQVGEDSAAVPLAADLAGAVAHLDQRLDGALEVAVGGAAGLVEEGDDGAGVALLRHQSGGVVGPGNGGSGHRNTWGAGVEDAWNRHREGPAGGGGRRAVGATAASRATGQTILKGNFTRSGVGGK